jgi:hypothetical protein
MAIEAESFVGDASERVMSLAERSVAGRRSRFSEKKSLRAVFVESARVSVRQSRALVSLEGKSRTSRYSATPRRGPFQISSRQLGVADQ